MLNMLIALVLFLVPLAYSPGPGNMFFAANGARFGFRSTLPASLGYHLATFLVTAIIGMGFAGALQAYPGAFSVLKVLGACYVLRIAWRLFMSGAATAGPEARPAGFRDGVLLLLLNPKAYVIITLMFTQFLAPPAEGQAMVVLAITAVFTVNNLLAFSLWTWIGDRLAASFRVPEQARRLNRLFGGVLASVALWMLLA